MADNSEAEFESDLEWLAFLYVSGEMSEAESARFETRMTEEVEVCQAVADATILVSAVTTATGEFVQGTPARKAGPERGCVPSSTQHDSKHCGQAEGIGQELNTRCGGILAAVACLACLILIGFTVFRTGDSGHEVASPEKSNAHQLVSEWASAGSKEIGSETVDASVGELFEDDGFDAHGLGLEVPNWMLMAVESTEATPENSDNKSEKL